MRRVNICYQIGAALVCALMAVGWGALPFEAAKSGDLAVLEKQAQNESDLDGFDAGGETLLLLAARGGHTTCVAYLLDHGASIDKQSKGEETPLYAAAHGRRAVVELLVSRGAAIDKRCTEGKTALFAAVEAQDAAVVKYLLEHGADVHVSTHHQDFPIHMAARKDNGAILQALIDAGADPDSAEESGAGPLLRAADSGKLGNVKMLLAAGATLRMDQAYNPLSAASHEGYADVVAYLKEYMKNPPTVAPAKRKFNPLLAAILKDDRDAVGQLLQQEQYQNYETLSDAIGFARRHGRVEIERRLRQANVQEEMRKAEYKKLGEDLMMAIGDKQYKKVEGLLLRGADANYLHSSEVPLNRSVIQGLEDISLLLLRYRADPFIRDSHIRWGWPFGDAASRGQQKFVEECLKLKPSQMDLDEALRRAVSSPKNIAIVRLLLNAGADVNAASSSKNTALHSAVSADQAMVELLVKAGAKIDQRDNAGRSAADFAALNGREEIVALLKKLGAAAPKAKVRSPLFPVVMYGDLKGVQKLVAAGNSLNVTAMEYEQGEEVERSLLYFAIMYSWRPEIVRYLIEQQAQGEPWLLQELVCRGEKFDLQQLALIELMVKKGYDVNGSENGTTPLIEAAVRNNARAAEMLIKLGAKLDGVNSRGETALKVARSFNHEATIKVLTAAGASK